MNEKNKNEQTFSDLFSNITTDKNSNTTTKSSKENDTISFNNLNNSNIEKDKDNLTINDIFSNKETPTKIEENFSDFNKKNTDSTSNIFDSLDKKEESQSLSSNSIEENSTKEENKKINNIFDNISNKEISKKETLENSSISTDKTLDSAPTIDFFDNSNSEKEDEKVTIKTDLQDKNSNIFQKNSIEDKPNPFFDNPVNTNQEEPKTSGLENKDTNNPFFNKLLKEETSNMNELNQQSDINSDKTEEENKEDSIPEKKEEPKEQLEENPFFADSTAPKTEDESNPFFENKINLVENHPHQNQNNTIDTSNVKHFNVKIVNKKEPLLKFILGVISYAMFILLLLIGITLLIYVADIKIREAKGDTSPPTYNAYVVLTGSMLPEIQVYDVVVTKKTDPKDLKEGDVITFASSDTRFLGTIITHRIIKKIPPSGNEKDYTFQTQGDNNNVADSAIVQANNIYGKVILKIPKLGYLQEFLATDGGWILVILLPCLIVVSFDVVTLAKRMKKKKYKNLKVQK